MASFTGVKFDLYWHFIFIMLSNPYVDRQKELERQAKEKDAFRHEFSVNMVVRDTDNITDIRAFTLVKNFCTENHVIFSAREYDSDRYNEDRDYIIKLPAYHMYGQRGKDYWATFYPNENPIQKIQDEIVRYRKEQEQKQAKKEAWNRRVKGIIAFFELLSLKKKPALNEPLPKKKKALPAKVPVEFSE